MKRFLLYSLKFTVVIFTVVILLGEIEFSDQFLIDKTKNGDYDKIAWNLNLINKYPERIEESNVFLGNSHTLHGISDSLLTFSGQKAVNFGVPHKGNELSLYFLKRIGHLRPKAIFFLKDKLDPFRLHPITPLLYTPSGLLNSGQRVNFYLLPYLFKRAKYTFEYLSFISSSTKYEYPRFGMALSQSVNSTLKFDSLLSISIRKSEYTNLHLNNYLKAYENPNLITNIRALLRRLADTKFFPGNVFNNSMSQNEYMESAMDECNNTHIPFYRYYVPIITDVIKNTDYKRAIFFENESDQSVLVLSDYSFLNDKAYWKNSGHLSTEGAILFTSKLALEHNMLMGKYPE